MANNLTRNTSTKIAERFAPAFEASRVLTKTVTTDSISADFSDAKYGDTTYIKRPHDYVAAETAGGDLTAVTDSDIVSATAPAVVQNYITVSMNWSNREETLQLNQLDKILQPAAERLSLQLESNLATYMIQRSGLHRGTVGTAITTWSSVADTRALATQIGVPTSGDFYAVMNPFAVSALANATNGLQSGDVGLVNDAWKRAQISRDFAGATALTASTLQGVTLGAGAGASGITIKTSPDCTYLTNKDTMTQTIVLTGFTASLANAVRAGDTLRITTAGKYRLNAKTRQVAFDNSGALQIHLKVLTGGSANGSGDVTVTVANAAIYEANGQYNNVNAALVAGDTVSVLGTASAIVQPSLMYHKSAFGVGFVDLPKLSGWDSSVITSDDGLSIRVTKYSDPRTNQQKIRFDLLPVFATFNPMFAGTFYG